MRSMVITAAIVIFCIVTTVISSMNLLPQVNIAATEQVNQKGLQQFTKPQDVSTDTNPALNNYYTMLVNVIGSLFMGVVSCIFIAVPLHNLGVPWEMAIAANGILGLLVFFDQIAFWRGTNW